MSRTHKQLWREVVWPSIRNDPGRRRDESRIGQRALLARKIELVARNGWVGFNTHQMDCDCASWSHFENIPASVAAVDREIDRLYANAEGPASFWLSEPDSLPEGSYNERDHALEAFENGHPHVVYF